MAKIKHSYSNNELLEELKDRDSIYDSIKNEVNGYKYNDEELKILDNLEKLTQFERDLLYLSSKMSVYDVADLYGVSPSLLYRNLRNIQIN